MFDTQKAMIVRDSDGSGCGQFGSHDPGITKNWFAVFTTPRHEKRIESHFGLRRIENFLPLYEKQRQWKDGSKGTLHLPLFSNYIFARIGWDQRVAVLKVPGVISIVGRGMEPVADAYIHFLREGLRLGKIEPHPYVAIGTRIRIRSGVMSGMEGVLLRKKNNFRVVLTLEMIMKSVTVEVAMEDIEPVVRFSREALIRAAEGS
jgi:transcription antitermination factor NusG